MLCSLDIDRLFRMARSVEWFVQCAENISIRMFESVNRMESITLHN